MAAPTGYPSFAYNPTQPAVIVQSLAQFNLLPPPGVWSSTPYPAVPPSTPSDPGFIITDARLQQLLIELRIANQLQQQGFNLPADVDMTGLRAEIALTDSSITS